MAINPFGENQVITKFGDKMGDNVGDNIIELLNLVTAALVQIIWAAWG